MDVRVHTGRQQKALPVPSNHFTWSGAPNFLLMGAVGRKRLEKSTWKDKSRPQAKADTGREQQLGTLRGEEMPQVAAPGRSQVLGKDLAAPHRAICHSPHAPRGAAGAC